MYVLQRKWSRARVHNLGFTHPLPELQGPVNIPKLYAAYGRAHAHEFVRFSKAFMTPNRWGKKRALW